MKKNYFVAIVILITLMSGNIHGANRTIVDMSGRKVQIPSQIKRVFTDRFTSLLTFSIAPEMLVNATFSVNSEAKKYISPLYYTNKPLTDDENEEILKLKPDIIILGNLNGQGIKDEANRLQAQVKIPVVIVDFTLQDYLRSYPFLGDILNKKEEAKQFTGFINKYLTSIHKIAKTISASSKPKLYYAEGIDGLNTEPTGSIHSQVIDFLYGKNVAKTSLGNIHGMSKVSMEQVMTWNPDLILVWTGYPSGMGLPGNAAENKSTMKYILSNPIWKRIAAVKKGAVYQIPSLPFGWFDRPPSSNALLGVLWLAPKLYPNLIKYDQKNAIKEYFKLFYHKNLSVFEINELL